MMARPIHWLRLESIMAVSSLKIGAGKALLMLMTSTRFKLKAGGKMAKVSSINSSRGRMLSDGLIILTRQEGGLSKDTMNL